MNLPSLLERIAQKLHRENGRAILVGGAVRDMVMGHPIKDYDIEVYGLESLDVLEGILSEFGSINQVGKSFGIVKLKADDVEYDFSFPRKEEKTGKGHKGFDVTLNGTLPFSEASKRRDFTINAMGYDILTGEILDPFGGLNDIQYRILRHIDDETFVEDPLRIYRAVQFAARFGFELAEETFLLCGKMVEQGMLEELPKERVYAEWKKLLLKSGQPSIGFEIMRSWGIVERYFPELYALVGVPQDPKWHPEGDVWTHTMLALDCMSRELKIEDGRLKMEDEKKRLKLLFSVLCHDFGKPSTTTIEMENGKTFSWQEYRQSRSVSKETHTNIFHLPSSILHLNRICAIGHEKAGLEPTRTFLYRLMDEHDFIESILPLVEHHLKPLQFYKQGAKASAIRRLATKVNIEELVLVAKADFLGRTTKEAQSTVFEAGEWLLEKARSLKVEKRPMKSLVQGRDLIALGLKPSPKFKIILDEIYELQMEDVLKNREDALAYIDEKYIG